MRSKNFEEPCESRYCASNYAEVAPIEKIEVAAAKRQTKLAPANADSMPEKYVSVDQSQVLRNRELRAKVDEQRQQEAMIRQKYQFNIPQARLVAADNLNAQQSTTMDAASTKLRLIMVLPALQNMGLEYRFISETFEAAFKGQDVDSNRDTSVIYSFMVYPKEELADSDACYAAAIRGVTRTTTTNYGAIAQIVKSLVDVAKDFSQVHLPAK